MSMERIFSTAKPLISPIDRRAFRFLLVLVLTALAPPMLMLLAGTALPLANLSGYTLQILVVLGTAHVGLTSFFWSDRRYQRQIDRRPMFFYAFPAAVTILSIGAVFLTGKLGYNIVSAGSVFWLTYHFAKQNWGVVCLSASATGATRPAVWLKHLYVVASIGAATGTLVPDPAAEPILHLLWSAGAVLVGGCAIAALAYTAIAGAARAHPLHLALLGMGAVFFTPIYLLGSTSGLIVIGTVHGLHYATLMAGISADQKQGVPFYRLLALVAGGIGLLVVFWLLTRTDWWGDTAPLMLTLYLCIQAWHFIVDSDLWRLTNPIQRQAIRESFPYLFPNF
jgi:hypothetical protein